MEGDVVCDRPSWPYLLPFLISLLIHIPAFLMSFTGLPLAVLDADETNVETRCRTMLLMLQMYACTS